MLKLSHKLKAIFNTTTAKQVIKVNGISHCLLFFEPIVLCAIQNWALDIIDQEPHKAGFRPTAHANKIWINRPYAHKLAKRICLRYLKASIHERISYASNRAKINYMRRQGYSYAKIARLAVVSESAIKMMVQRGSKPHPKTKVGLDHALRVVISGRLK